MLYTIKENTLQASYEDSQYPQLRNEANLYWLPKHLSLTTVVGFNEEGVITEPTKYELTYDEKLNSLRFKRDWLLSMTDAGVTTDTPLSEERVAELKAYRQSLRDMTKSITDIDTYILPQPSDWMVSWFKL